MRSHTQQDAFYRRAVRALGRNHTIPIEQRERAIELARIIAKAKGEDTAIEKLGTKDLRVLSIGAAYAERGSGKGREFSRREPLHDEQPSDMQIRKKLRDARDRAIEFLKDFNTVLAANVNDHQPRIAEALSALDRIGMLDEFKRENVIFFEFLQIRFGMINHIITNVNDVVGRLNMTTRGKYGRITVAIERGALSAVSSYVARNEEKIKASRIKLGSTQVPEGKSASSTPESTMHEPQAEEPKAAEPGAKPKTNQAEPRLRQICGDDLRPESVIELLLTADASQIFTTVASRLGNGANSKDVAALLRREADSFTTIETHGEGYYAWKRGGPGRHTPICPVSQGNPADVIMRKAEEIERLSSGQ